MTAVRICENDAVHVETESVLTSSEIIKLATEDEPGRIQYKASFNNSAFEGQIKIIEIPMLSSKKPIFVSWLLGINPIIVILVGLVFIGGLIVGMVGVFRAKRRRR